MPCFKKTTTKSHHKKVYSFYLCQLVCLRPDDHHTVLLASLCLSELMLILKRGRLGNCLCAALLFLGWGYLNDYGTVKHHFARIVVYTLVQQCIIMEMLVKHLWLVHHKGFKRNSAHLEDGHGSCGRYLCYVGYVFSVQTIFYFMLVERKKREQREVKPSSASTHFPYKVISQNTNHPSARI